MVYREYTGADSAFARKGGPSIQGETGWLVVMTG